MTFKKYRSVLLLSSVLLLQPAFAQNLPGTAIDEATVSADVKAMFELAAQAYPALFVGGSGWRTYSGYTFKFFSASGMYVGIKDGQVSLLGGQFGNTITPRGSVASVSTALQNYITVRDGTNPGPSGTTADFGGVLAAKTLADLVNNFSSLTMEYGTSIGTFGTISQIKIEVVGKENVGSTSTDHLKVTIGTKGTAGVTYDMWVDSAGTVVKLINFGQEMTGSSAQFLGTGLVSSFLISLAASDTPQVKAALAAQLTSPALSTKITQRIVGNTTLPTLQLTVSGAAGSGQEISAYLSDFGSFTMMTQYSATLGTTKNTMELIDMQLR